MFEIKKSALTSKYFSNLSIRPNESLSSLALVYFEDLLIASLADRASIATEAKSLVDSLSKISL